MKKTTRIPINIEILLVTGIVLFLVSCHSSYNTQGREKIQNYILSRIDLFKPIKSDTIIVFDNDFHECSEDKRDFVNKKYTRPCIEKTLKRIGFKKIIFATNDYISVNGCKPISINTCGNIFPKFPVYNLHIWEETLLLNKKLITINEAFSNIDTSIVIKYTLEWKDNDFKMRESEIKSFEISFEENPEKKGIFYPIEQPKQSIDIKLKKTKELIDKFTILFEGTIKNDSTLYTYAWHTWDSLSPLFTINFSEKSSKTIFKPIGAFYNPKIEEYNNLNTYSPDKRYNQYTTFMKSFFHDLIKFNSIDSLFQLGTRQQISKKYVESNEIFNKIKLIAPDYAIYLLHVNTKVGINYYNMNQINLAIDQLLIENDLEHNYSAIMPDLDTYKYLSMCYKIKNQPEMVKKYDKEYTITKKFLDDQNR